MKAWVANIKDAEWCLLIHGETAGRAKRRFMRCEPSTAYAPFVDLRVRRYPGLDDKPFTQETIRDEGFWFVDENGNPVKSGFINDCDCELCRSGLPAEI